MNDTSPQRRYCAGDVAGERGRAIGRGKGSGIEVETQMAHIWTMHDDKAVRTEIFRTPAEALEAAGPSE